VRKSIVVAVCILTVFALLIAACGDDDDDGGETVDAATYTADICTTIGDWLGAIQAGAEEAGQLDPGASPEEGKEVLTSYIDDSLAETTTARDALADAGVPDVEGGAETADGLVAAFDGAVDIFEQASSDAADLPTDSPQAFQEAATELGTSTQQSLEEVGSGLQDLEESEALSTAAEDSQECQDLAGITG
jgi:hypothetical protein